MCIICESKDDPEKLNQIKQSLYCCSDVIEIPIISGLKELNCCDCTRLTKIPLLPGLKKIWCTGCTNLTEIANIPGLRLIWCTRCVKLTEIPNIVGLEDLWCPSCTGLTEIPNIIGLEDLWCSGCVKITSIPNIIGLKTIRCEKCLLLTEIPTFPNIHRWMNLNCSDCPWLPQNPKNKIHQGLKLQRWIKNNFRFFVFKHWISSVEGKEFLYHPNHIGGRIEKSKMKKTLLSLN